jgi:hypothetical protein
VTEPDEFNRAVGDAVTAAVNQLEHGVVTRWVAVIESIDPDGARGVWLAGSEDLKPWDTLGLLHFGILEEQSQALADRLQGDR